MFIPPLTGKSDQQRFTMRYTTHHYRAAQKWKLYGYIGTDDNGRN